ncbi:CaiB/BaiF CoA transferase family protein [Pararhizobium haloflavum]|uniref:CaiB/BaiF CoA transferase family protein n=1 Tax=Pararhizobium haloflavum TaxID=2037914 RepID=UPI0012FFDA23|nr:CaiB/BaiF CoA-transferase family protein [Pararhizobium haloflavum]
MDARTHAPASGEHDTRPYPLAGVKVLDFSHVLSGPHCTMLLADLGAEVVKVERPGTGDENRRMRSYAGRQPHDEDYFYPMNRNKKSIEVNLKDPADRERVITLMKTSDVVVENFTPGAMKKLGLDYESAKVVNPRLVYCSISGYGQTGPYRNRKAYDSIIQAFAGVMSITGEADGPPLRSGLMFADLTGAMYALSAILVSLYARERTGLGNYIDLSMSDALLSLYSTNAAEYMATGKSPGRAGSENPGRSPTGSYLCADDRYVQVMGGSDRLWPGFCAAVGRPDLAEDVRFASNEARIANRKQLRAILTPVFRSKPSAEWVEQMSVLGLPIAPINTLADAMNDPHFQHREMDLRLEHPRSGEIRTINNPFRFSTYATWQHKSPPLLGQHNDEYR